MNMTGKVLFVSSFIGHNFSGGSVASARNLEMCKQLFPSAQVDAYGFSFRETPVVTGVTYLASHKSQASTFINYCFGNAGSITFANLRKLEAIYLEGNYPVVFLDGSLLGKLAKKIKKLRKDVIIISFFHNVEKQFFLSKLATNFFWLPLFWSAIYNERLSTRYANYILCFNDRDSRGIKKNYGKHAFAVVPITVNDRLTPRLIKPDVAASCTKQPKLLFVGSDFYANVYGIRWFVNKVMPFVEATCYVVGKGMEKYKAELDGRNVEVLGYVNDIDKLYYDADVVVAPVFSGSGMKVKTAEALMMGKTVLATSEAWQGYIEASEAGGVECNSASEFILAINTLDNKKLGFNEKARAVFEKYYSSQSLQSSVSILSNEIKKQLNGNV